MLTPRQARLAYLPLMLLGMLALLGLGAIVAQQGLEAGSEEFWLLTWVFAFVLLLPVTMLLLPIADALMHRLTRPVVVPVAGEKIPEAGQ